jgi:hypothetical protein
MNTTVPDGAVPVDLTGFFAPWVEWREEVDRSGRCLLTAVNHRDGHAIYIDRSELSTCSSRRAAVVAELEHGGFLVYTSAHCDVSAGPSRVDTGLVWRGVDRFVQRLHDCGADRLFRPGWVVGQVIVAVAGAVAIARTITTGGVEVHAQAAQVPAIILLGLVVVFVHELGHALVTTHYGRHVRTAGLRLHLGAPAFYVESLDALLLTRRQRLLQVAAGPWAEWLATSAVAFCFLSLGTNSGLAAIFHRFVLVNTFVIANNLLPFVGLDGALLFADAVGRPDLPFRTSTALRRPASEERWIVVYSVLNALVAAGLFIVAGYFWWQLFGGLIATLWAHGPAGVTTVAVLGVLLGRQLSGTFGHVFATARAHAGSIWSKIVFRLERRWRVEAINALRSLPELAELGAEDLGIIAGRLQRCCGRNVALPPGSSHIYVRSGPPLQNPTGPVMRQRIVVALDQLPRFDLTGQRDVVVLTTGWQTYLNS